MFKNFGNSVVFNLLPSIAAVAATTNQTGVDTKGYDGPGTVVVNVSAATAGSSPTFDLKLQSSADNSTGWTDITGAAITQVTNANSVQVFDIDLGAVSRYVRAVVAVGGTSTPSFPASATMVAMVKQ